MNGAPGLEGVGLGENRTHVSEARHGAPGFAASTRSAANCNGNNNDGKD